MFSPIEALKTYSAIFTELATESVLLNLLYWIYPWKQMYFLLEQVKTAKYNNNLDSIPHGFILLITVKSRRSSLHGVSGSLVINIEHIDSKAWLTVEMDNSRKWPAFVIGHLWGFYKPTFDVNCKVESDKERLILELFSNKPFCYDVIHDNTREPRGNKC